MSHKEYYESEQRTSPPLEHTRSDNYVSRSIERDCAEKSLLLPAFTHDNLLKEFMSDEQYSLLRKHGLLSEKALRDYHIRLIFKELRQQNFTVHQAIERIQSIYSYLQFDTVRKIIYYSRNRNSSGLEQFPD